MAKICILSALLLLYTSVHGQNSPCPDHFTYIKKRESDETIGRIEIRNPPKNNLEHILKVDLKVATELPTSFVGGVELTESKEVVVRDIFEGWPLLYHIRFPVQYPLPTVHGIWFNNEQICYGPEISGDIVTTITLEHTLKIIIRSRQSSALRRTFLNRSGEQEPTVSPSLTELTLTPPSCGISSNRSRSPNLLNIHDSRILPGQWPWVAAIFKVAIEHEYICGGTVLTTRHVLTAGHCLKTDKNETIPPNILLVALGRYKLLDFNEEGSVTREVARHISHPDYTNTESGDSDLAILILRSPVEFTALIRPICLRSISVDPHRPEEMNGIVVGWGEDEHGNPYTEEPRMVNMPIVTADVCLRSHPSFYRLTSERTFCAGWRNHSSPCNGDSGSGLMIFDYVTGRYHLRGIVSRSVFDTQLICDQTQFVVYVDVFKYLPWINEQMYST